MNTFKTLMQMCGLTADSATPFLEVHRRAVIRWCKGATPDRAAVMALSELHHRQQLLADEIINGWEAAGKPPEITINVARDDAGAREMGWPSLSAQIAPAALAQAVLSPVEVKLSPVDGATAKDGQDPAAAERAAAVIAAE